MIHFAVRMNLNLMKVEDFTLQFPAIKGGAVKLKIFQALPTRSL